MSYRMACSSVSWGDTPDVAGMLKEIRTAGYAGVEFQQSIDWLGNAEALRDMTAAEGLEIAAFYYGSALLARHADEIDQHKRAMDYAAQLGTRLYMVAGGWISGRTPDDADYATLAENLDTLATYARERGLVLSFHPHMGSIVESLEQIDKLFGYSRDATTLCPDTAHLAAAGSDSVKTIQQYVDKVTHVHLKDYERPSDGLYKPTHFVELGNGDVGLDFEMIFASLAEIRYNEWIVVELDIPRQSAFASAKQSMEFLARLPGCGRGFSAGADIR